MRVLREQIDWRDCEFVSLANASRIAGRGPNWVRRAICVGDLEAVKLPTGGPEVVTVASLRALLERSRRVEREALREAGKPRPPYLTVVSSD